MYDRTDYARIASAIKSHSLNRVLLLTTTFYTTRDSLRYRIAAETVKRSISAGYEIIVVDGSPEGSGVAEALNAIGASVHAQTEKGMGGSRRQVFSLGYQRSREAGYKGVLWLEPEKDDLIRFVPRIIEPILRDEADISIPFRTKISWRSYPVFQVQSEKKGNEAIAQLTKRTGFDHFFGPVAYSAAATRYVIAMKPIEIGDGLIIDSYIPQYAPILAFRDGAVGSSVPIDFMYNPEQKYEEEVLIQDVMMMKRERQLWEMLQVCKKLAAMKREEQLIKCY